MEFVFCKHVIDDPKYKSCSICREKQKEIRKRYYEKNPDKKDEKNGKHREYMKRKRMEPEFVEKERIYQEEYCNIIKKG